jgi:peptidoglycan-associated lipoprotein
MTTHRRPARLFVFSTLATSVAALALATSACEGEKQAPPATAHEVAPAIAPPPPPPSAPPETHVAIADDIARACGISAPDAYFTFDSSKLESKAHSPLETVATCFTHGPLAGRSVKLVGRTDPRGESDYNMTLGQSRADSVAGYLEGHGVSASKASSTSRGAMDATGTDEKGWSRDRRVDVMLAD